MALLDKVKKGLTFDSPSDLPKFMDELSKETNYPLKIGKSQTIKAYNTALTKVSIYAIGRFWVNFKLLHSVFYEEGRN